MDSITVRKHQKRNSDISGGKPMKEWWEDHFNKQPDPDYILSVLIDIYERQHGVKVVVEK